MNAVTRTAKVRSSLTVGSWILATLGASYVLIAHRAHALEWLPFALLLACPLMHIFMHRGHGHRSHEANDTAHRH